MVSEHENDDRRDNHADGVQRDAGPTRARGVRAALCVRSLRHEHGRGGGKAKRDHEHERHQIEQYLVGGDDSALMRPAITVIAENAPASTAWLTAAAVPTASKPP